MSKTNGKVIGELMTTAPMVVRETTNLEDAARFFYLNFSLASVPFESKKKKKNVFHYLIKKRPRYENYSYYF